MQALISGSSREQASGQRVNLDASVQNTPNEKTVRVPSEKQVAQNQRITSVTGPVSSSKQASHLGLSPGSLDPNGPSKKKKKPKAWSKEEDADLATGVQKYGEGNWDYILHKCKFDNTRTPDQLSQVRFMFSSSVVINCPLFCHSLSMFTCVGTIFMKAS